MADVQSSGNNSSGKRTESVTKTCSLLKPSSFTSSNVPTPVAECGGLTGNFGNNPFASNKLPAGNSANDGSVSQVQHDNENPTPSKFFLRPSTLDKHTSNLFKESNFGTPVKSNSFKLEPPKLFSPFSLTATLNKSSDAADSEKEKAISDTEKTTEETVAEATCSTENSHSEKKTPTDGRPDTQINDDQSEPGAENKSAFIFGENLEARVTAVPVTGNSESTVSAAPGVSDGFIFGSNIENRVVMQEQTETNLDEKESHTHCPETSQDDASASGPSSSLSQDAAKRQAKSAENKLEFKPVEVVTGEEKESNVFQFNTKLYVFNKASQTWVERGRGLLRLNDRTEEDTRRPFQSRLVMRTQGSLRVILNTMIWSGMLVERASAKSIQISAVDGEEGVKIFLLNANPNDAEQIFNAITSRVQQLKVMESSGKQSAKELSPSASTPKKRTLESENSSESCKKQKLDQDQRREQVGEESNDSSALYPETEASNEGFASSPTIRSSSSSSDA